MSGLINCSATMVKQGSFSYFNDNIDTKSLYNVRNVRVRIERMTSEVARIYFVDDADNLINNIPPGMTFRNITLNQVVQHMPIDIINRAEFYVILWTYSYVLQYNGHEVYRLDNQRQQAINIS
jgi:hypothetical protein